MVDNKSSNRWIKLGILDGLLGVKKEIEENESIFKRILELQGHIYWFENFNKSEKMSQLYESAPIAVIDGDRCLTFDETLIHLKEELTHTITQIKI